MPQFPGPGQMFPNAMGFGMNPGMFPNMGWNGDFNPMAQFMPNAMFFQNAMGKYHVGSFCQQHAGLIPDVAGMPGMGMDPMAAQGMFGGYGMSMNGMNNGMNMGMNFDAGQGMYGGWDGSQNNMWNGGQDKFNPNAFPNGMGPEFGGPSGFGGYNMSQPHGNYQMQQQQQFPNQDFQNGFYGPGYGRGNARGRGRGFFPGGRDRGGFMGPMQANYPANTNYPGFQNQQAPNMQQQPNGTQAKQDAPGGAESAGPTAEDIKKFNDELAPGGENDLNEEQQKPTTDSTETKDETKDTASDAKAAEAPSTNQAPAEESQQLRGIPTIETIDQAAQMPNIPTGPAGYQSQHGPGFGRGGFPMRPGFQGGRFANGPFGHTPHQPVPPTEPRGQGVEGAPAAPRAMREGLPNTSIRRMFPGRTSLPPPAPAPKPTEDTKRYVLSQSVFFPPV